MADRCNYAKGTSASPEIVQEGTQGKWRPAAWESDKRWLISLSAKAPKIAIWFLLCGFIYFGYVVLEANFGPIKTRIDRANRVSAIHAEHWLRTHSFTVFLITMSCIIGIYAWRRWLRSLLISSVILERSSLAYRFSFQDKQQDSVALASAYIALLTLVVTIVALI